MSNHDIELPPLPKGDIAADTCPVMWVHTDQQIESYARAAIEADRQRRGEVDRNCRQVLESVKEQFDRFGGSLPDGFDSRVFRWVEDALSAPQPADPDGTLTNEGTKSDDPVGGEYPSNAWVTAFFGSPDDSGFYYFRGDFGNIAHRYKNSAKHLLPQPADPVVKDSLTTPDGWQLVPIKPTEAMLNQGESEWSSRYEANRGYRAMLQAAPTYSDTPKRLEDMSKSELIDLIESERDKHQMELDAIGAGGVSGKMMS